MNIEQLNEKTLMELQEIAKETNAVYKVKRCVLVNTEKVDEYLENFCEM